MLRAVYDLVGGLWKEKIQLAAMVLFVATLPLNREVNQVFFVVLVLSCLPLCKYELWVRRRKIIVAFIIIYLIAVFSSFYAPDKKAAISTLELQLALLLSPVLIGISYQPSKEKDNLIKTGFISGICVSLVYLFIIFLYKMNKEQLSISAWLQQENLNHQYSSPIGMHATILSTYVAVCASLIIEFLGSAKRFSEKVFLFFLFALCIISLFLLSSRMVLAISGISFILLIFLNPRPYWWPGKVLIGAFLLVSLIAFIDQSSYFKARFNQDIQKDLKWSQWKNLVFNPHIVSKDSVLKNDGTRIERWIASIELIKEKPLFGYGTGQEKPQLFRKYREMGLTVTLEQGYDAHNQFLSIMIKSGLIGLITLLILFGTAFYLSIKNKDLVYFSFLLVITAVCIVENYLNVNKGVFFFSFFNIFFAISFQNRGKQK